MNKLLLSLVIAGTIFAQTPAAPPMTVVVSQVKECHIPGQPTGPCVRVVVTSSDPNAFAYHIILTYTRADGTTGTTGTFMGLIKDKGAALFSLTDVTNIKAHVTALSPYAVVDAEPEP